MSEIDCAECRGTGVAERIGGYDRPCDVCGGDGRLSARTPPMTNPKHTDTSRSGDLVASLRALSAWLIANDLDMKLPDEVGDPDDAADRLEALEAENERLNGLILATADHWLALQCDHSVEWAGAIDTAMEAACDEIRRLSAALGEK